jgi:hypothetical protein
MDVTNRIGAGGLVAAALVFCGGVRTVAAPPATVAPLKSLDEAVPWLQAKSWRMINASRREMPNGVAAFPPQAGAGYEAFWLRDYAYMLEGCADAFTDKELIDSCLLFVGALRADGAGVDCVKFSGQPIYQPGYGSMGANPVADGSQFTVEVAWYTYQRTKDRRLLAQILDKLAKTMEAAPRHPKTRLIHIKPEGWDRCPYGFTDSVRKQGDELFCSLLFVQACRQLGDLMDAAGRAEDAQKWRREAEQLVPVIRETFWDEKIGLFRAATIRCTQPDIWGSAFAVYLDVATPRQAQAIARYFKDHYREIVERGQIRHLPGGVYWDAACGPDTYQNGGYWATPTGWLVYTLDLVDPKLADQTVVDMVNDFRSRGVTEWVLGPRTAVKNYLASATMPLAGVRRVFARRGRPFPALEAAVEQPNGPSNLACAGNGAKPATASSEYPDEKHKAKGLNDGKYGNSHSWIGTTARPFFQIELARAAKVGRFKLGRDRDGVYSDRAAEYLKIEVSLDGRQWQTVFEKKDLSSVAGFDPQATMVVQVSPVEAKFVKVTVGPKDASPADFVCIDEFEVYAPATVGAASLPAVRMEGP